MAREAIDFFDVGADLIAFAENGHFFIAITNFTTECVFGTVTHKEHGILRVADAIFEVVQNAPSLAHARSCYDDRRALQLIQFLGSPDGSNEGKILKTKGIFFFKQRIIHFAIEALGV